MWRLFVIQCRYMRVFWGNLSSVSPFALERTDGHGEGHVCLKWWKSRSCKGGGTVAAVEEIVWAGSGCVWRASLDGRCSHHLWAFCSLVVYFWAFCTMVWYFNTSFLLSDPCTCSSFFSFQFFREFIYNLTAVRYRNAGEHKISMKRVLR